MWFNITLTIKSRSFTNSSPNTDGCSWLAVSPNDLRSSDISNSASDSALNFPLRENRFMFVDVTFASEYLEINLSPS